MLLTWGTLPKPLYPRITPYNPIYMTLSNPYIPSLGESGAHSILNSGQVPWSAESRLRAGCMWVRLMGIGFSKVLGVRVWGLGSRAQPPAALNGIADFRLRVSDHTV